MEQFTLHSQRFHEQITTCAAVQMVATQITGFSPIQIQRLTVERPKYLIEFEVDVDINHIHLTLLQVERWLRDPLPQS